MYFVCFKIIMKTMKRLFVVLFALLGAGVFAASEGVLELSLQSRGPNGAKLAVPAKWEPTRTAFIVCDMWDAHGCRNAALREKEMLPRFNEVLEKLREQGVFIIHAPSSCMKAYEGTPARRRAQEAPTAARIPPGIDGWCSRIPSEEWSVYPLDQSDGGCDDDAQEHEVWAKALAAEGRDPKTPWQRQADALRIDQEKDAVSDSGTEIWNLLESKGIQNVILGGVHTNMCVAGRPFGLRQMVRNGRTVVLVRDLTDTMYNPGKWPFVSHQRGTELFIQHVERRICATISSEQILGGKPFAFSAATAGAKRVQVLLLGDSTTEASIPKMLAPEEPQFEDAVRMLLAAQKDLPPADVYNLGLSGEYIRRLLDSGRYDRDVAGRASADYIFIRYGLNDRSKREGFKENFAKDFHELLGRLRKDHPKAVLIPMTVIPYQPESDNSDINGIVEQVAREAGLPLFDIHPRYAKELSKGPNMLNYRRYALERIPEELRPLVRGHVIESKGKDAQVIVLDNRLDGVLGHLPGWFSDRHPNLAGYQVIASETAAFLAPLMRKKSE